MDRSFLDWPFLELRHKELAFALDAWTRAELPTIIDRGHDGWRCRARVRSPEGASEVQKIVIARQHLGSVRSEAMP